MDFTRLEIYSNDFIKLDTPNDKQTWFIVFCNVIYPDNFPQFSTNDKYITSLHFFVDKDHIRF